MNDKKSFCTLTLAAACLALFVIAFGAFVRLSDAGLGCPDWPGCYGRLVVPEAAHAVGEANAAFPDRPLEAPKAWKEMIHRYAASTLGLLIIGVAILAVRRRRDPSQPLVLPLLILALVILQGMLGMWTVTLLLKPLIVTLHLLGGMTTLLLLWWLAVRARWGGGPIELPGLKRWTVLALAVVYLQIALGGWTSSNYAAVACFGFPDCNGLWWPQMDFREAFILWRGLGINYEYGVLDSPARTAVHMAHRLGALATFVVVGLLALRCLGSGLPALKRAGAVLAVVLTVQVSLGIANVTLGLPLASAVAHNAVAGVLLLAVTTVLHLLTPAATENKSHATSA